MSEEADTAAIAEVREAYERLLSAFERSDTEEYFDCFHEEASFVFPGEPVMNSRATYRSTWLRWEREGLRFTDVVTDHVVIRVIGATALVTHRIRTTVVTGRESSVDRERETIVFSHIGGRWLAVHEHLSPEET